jgi:hypothetical protein
MQLILLLVSFFVLRTNYDSDDIVSLCFVSTDSNYLDEKCYYIYIYIYTSRNEKREEEKTRPQQEKKPHIFFFSPYSIDQARKNCTLIEK